MKSNVFSRITLRNREMKVFFVEKMLPVTFPMLVNVSSDIPNRIVSLWCRLQRKKTIFPYILTIWSFRIGSVHINSVNHCRWIWFSEHILVRHIEFRVRWSLEDTVHSFPLHQRRSMPSPLVYRLSKTEGKAQSSWKSSRYEQIPQFFACGADFL